MSIFSKPNEEGILDLGKARDELASARGITNENERKKVVAEVTAGALLDIAASLRPLAAEALYAMQPTRWVVQDEPEESNAGEGGEAPAWMLLDVGSWVEGVGMADHIGRIAELAIREDEPSARVQWYSRDGKPVQEGWSFLAALFESDSLDLGVDHGLRVEAAKHESDIAGEPESSIMIAEGIPAHVESDDERKARVNREREERIAAAQANPEPAPEAVPVAGPDPMFTIGADDNASPAAEMRAAAGQATVELPDVVDDIDSDFDGDHHTATDDALAVLKANEKARKKAKSGKAKKGKKS